MLNNVTAETQSDWDFCFSGASNKADPNRLFLVTFKGLKRDELNLQVATSV